MDLVENDVDTLHEEINHLVGFSFIRVIDQFVCVKHHLFAWYCLFILCACLK